MLPLLILIVIKGGLSAFTAMAAVFSFLGLEEFYRMTMPSRRLERYLAATAGAFLPLLMATGDFRLGLGYLTGLVLISAIILLFRLEEMPRMGAETALLWGGFLYVPLLLSHLVLVRGAEQGVLWIFFLFVVVMCGDSAAYYVGSAIGRHKLYPAVSPNKSIEGSLGGLAGSVAGALLFRGIWFPELAIGHAVGAALLLGALGQVGDLFESMLKRSCGVKDSGTIIPGHGGVLDRLDSILFAAPALYLYAGFIAIAH